VTPRAGLSFAAVLLLAVACGKSKDAPPPPPAHAGGFTLTPSQRSRITIQTLAVTTFRPTVQTTGTVAFNGDRSTQVLANVGGPVARIFVQPGAYVTAGAPLATVASPDFAAAVATYRKAVVNARNLTRIATLDQQLFANDALARRDLEQAQTDAAGGQADLQAAVEQLRALGVSSATIAAVQAGQDPGPLEAVIRAPIAGTVVERLITPGQLLIAGSTPAFTVADLSTMWVMANVFETDLASAAPGERATISADAAPRPIVGRVDYVAALVDSATRATAVRIVVPNPGQVLKQDMFVRVAIQSRVPRQGILVPTSAILRDDNNLPFVFVALPDGSFDRRSIAIGPRVGNSYQAVSGLAAGDRVVSEGALFMQFAQSQGQ